MPVLHTSILIAGLAAASLPVIIHLLFRRRRTPVPWGAMRFVLEAHRKTCRRTNLERWLLMACRCLLVLALGVALARPLLQSVAPSSQGGRTLWIVIDDGLAAQTTPSPGANSDMRAAVDRATALLGTLGPGDRAAVVLSGSPARPLVVPPSGNLAGVRAALEAITPTESATDYPAAFTLLAQAIGEDRSARSSGTSTDWVVLPQTIRNGSARLDTPLPQLPPAVRLIAHTQGDDSALPQNVTIAGAKALRSVVLGGFGSGESFQTVTVQVQRAGGTLPAGVSRFWASLSTASAAAPVGESAAVTQVRWSPGQREATATLVVQSQGGDQPAAPLITVRVVEADAIAGDDVYRLPIVWRDVLRIGILADSATRGGSALGGSLGSTSADRLRPGQWVALALRPSESTPVELIDVEPAAVDSARLAGLDAVVLLSPDALGDPRPGAASSSAWATLRTFVDQGGFVLVTPPAEPGRGQWAGALAAGLGVQFAAASAPRAYAPGATVQLADGLTPLTSGDDLLAAIRGELAELARPVNFLRLQPPDVTPEFDARVLLRAGDGAAVLTILSRPQPGQGAAGVVVYLSSALDLTWTDLPTKPLMVPLLQELIRQGVGRARPVYAALAGQTPRVPPGSVEIRSMNSPSSAGVLTIAADGQAQEPLRTVGVWQAVDAAGADRGVVAINAPASAADPSLIAAPPLSAWLKSAVAAADSAVALQGGVSPLLITGDQWSRGLAGAAGQSDQSRAGTGSMLLLAALGLALAEVLLARRAAVPPVAAGNRQGGAQ